MKKLLNGLLQNFMNNIIMKTIEQFINEGNQNNEVLDYLKELYDTYTKKLNSYTLKMAETDKYSYVTYELKQILKKFNVDV